MVGVGVSLKSCMRSRARRLDASINYSAAREQCGRRNLSITCCGRMKAWIRKSITSAITPFVRDWSHRPISTHDCGDLVWGRVSDPSRPEGPRIFWCCEQLPSFARLDGSKTRPHILLGYQLQHTPVEVHDVHFARRVLSKRTDRPHGRKQQRPSPGIGRRLRQTPDFAS